MGKINDGPRGRRSQGILDARTLQHTGGYMDLQKALGRMAGAGRKARPTETVGVPGTPVYGGYVQEVERESSLVGVERYRTYSGLLANVSIVAAGVRFFLNLTAKSSWHFEPSEADVDGRYAELAEEMLTDDPATPWHRIVRRSAMYRFYGFSIQEWTARRRDDGLITLADVAPRPQNTIDRWDIDPSDGSVRGVVQRDPMGSREMYLPREKVLYLVDDTLNDSPEGLGLFRHLVAPAKRLRRYEQLEGWGFETDLRGIPIGRGPFAKLAQLEADGELTRAERLKAEEPLRKFIEGHVKTPELGMLLDSSTYVTQDEKGAPSNVRWWDLELLKAGVSGQAEVAAAITRETYGLARVLGVEGLLAGSEGSGSLALSRDKSQNLYLLVDGTLVETREAVTDDLLWRLWQLNGWDPELRPKVKTEQTQYREVEQVTAALKDMAQAGAVLAPDDPAINEIRTLVGLSPLDLERVRLEGDVDAALGGEAEGTPEDGDLPDDETEEGRE